MFNQENQGNLITEEKSAGIIAGSEVQEASTAIPSNVRVAGEQSPMTLPPTDLGAVQGATEVAPDTHSMQALGNPFAKESEAYQTQLEEKEAITYSDSLLASMKQWDVVGMFDQYNLEEKILDNEAGLYDYDEDFEVKEALDYINIPLSKEEVEWLNGKDITSQGAFDLYIKDIERKRELAREASVSPVTSTLLGFVDPTYIPLGLGVGKVAQVARMGRFGTSAVVGASEYAMVEAQTYHRPVDNFERVLGTVLPSAITMGLYRAPKSFQRLDGTKEVGESDVIGKAKLSEAEFDSEVGKPIVGKQTKETVDYVDNIDTINVTRNTPLVDKPEVILPEGKLQYSKNEYGMPRHSELDWDAPNSKGVSLKNTAYKWVYDVIEDTKIPKSVRDSTARLLKQAGRELAELEVKFTPKLKGQGRFNTKDNKIEIRGSVKSLPKTYGQTLNHEIVHGVTSMRIAYGKARPNSGHGQVVAEIEELRNYVRDQYRQRQAEFTAKEKGEIDYALQDTDEFLAGLFEGDTAFKKLMSETPTDKFKYGGEKSLLQSLYTGFKRLLGLTNDEATALNKALKLTDDLIDEPRVVYTGLDGTVKEFRASEITPELIKEVSGEEAESVFKEASKASGSSWDAGWNLHRTISSVSPEVADLLLASPYAGKMQGNVTSSKRALTVRLGIPRTDAEQMLYKELGKRGVKWQDRFFNTRKYHEEVRNLEGEVALYIESRSQAEKFGKALDDEDTVVAQIAKKYQEMTQEAKSVGIRSGIFDEAVGDVNWYLPRKIDPDNYMDTLNKFKAIYGDEKAEGKLIDAIASSLRLEGGDADYARHIAYIYHKRMHDRYHSAGDAFRSHMGDELVKEIDEYLDYLNVTDKLARERISNLLTGAVDSRGEASFQKARLDIDTLSEITLDDGSTFKFYDLMDKRVLDPFARYADNVSGRVALAEHGLGTPTLWSQFREKVTGSEKLLGKEDARRRYKELMDDIYNTTLGYPVGRQLHPFLVALRAFNTSIALKFSGIWQVMEVVPALARHAKVQGLGSTMKIAGTSLFKTVKGIEANEADSLLNVLMRGSMDDLKINPNSSRLADNYTINPNTVAGKLNHMSQYTHVMNGMRYLMGKQSIISANLIIDNIERATKGSAKDIQLLKKFGMDDADIKALSKEVSKHGTEFNKWDIDAKSDLLPKLMNLMDTDVLRSRTGEIPAVMEFSNVGKVLGTFRNFILSAHNKIFASQLRDEGVTAVALLTAYQLPVAMLSVQVASLAKGEGFVDDPTELFTKAFAQLGGLGLIPEMVGILTGETRSFGSPFLIGIDRAIGVGNALGNLGGNALRGESSMADVWKIGEATSNVLPVASVTLGWSAGMEAVWSTLNEFTED